MKKGSEYRAHARECRQLATRMKDRSQKDYLLQMAEDWEEMARYRAGLISLHPELAQQGEQEEEGLPPPVKSD